jgi:parvulin-like peptidyl-prolyl isomerase
MAMRTWALRVGCHLACAVLVALLAGDVLAQSPPPGTRAVAFVNGEPITLAEVDAILKARPLLSLKLSESERRELQKEALDMLIDDLLVQQFLRKNAPPAQPAQVNQKLKELLDALKTQGQTLNEYCRETAQTEAQVRTNIVNMLQRNAYLDSHLSEPAVRKYYEDNRDFFDEVTVHASHILLRVKPDTPAAERTAAEARIQAIRREIAVGKLDFAEAARQFSQCSSASRGGDLGYLQRRGAAEESFARMVFALKPGEISAVVETASGLHLIKVTDRKAGPPADFKQREGTVRAFAGEEMLRNILVQQRHDAQGTRAAPPGQPVSPPGR